MPKKQCIIFFLLLFLTILIHGSRVLGAYQLEYRIEVYIDGSARWAIEHRFLLETEDDRTMFRQYSNWTYFSDCFVENVKALVDMARLRTGRESMTVENFKMTVSVFDSYRVVKYEFDWIEFAEIEGTRIRIGDVFEVDGLFLYGDGTLNMIYPAGYMVERASPKPNDEYDRMLTWYKVEDFGRGEPKVVLNERTQTIGDTLKAYVPVIAALIALAGIGSTALWFFKFRKKKREAVVTVPPVPLGMEDDEEKVVSLLKSAGGRLYQSTITNQCEFSRAKTSKLLTSMEEKGRIKRQKKGREKVVILTDEVKEFRNAGN